MPTTKERLATISALTEKALQLHVDVAHQVQEAPNLTAFDSKIRSDYNHYCINMLSGIRFTFWSLGEDKTPNERGKNYKLLEHSAKSLPDCLKAIKALQDELLLNHAEKAPEIPAEKIAEVLETLSQKAETIIEIGNAVDGLMQSLRRTKATAGAARKNSTPAAKPRRR